MAAIALQQQVYQYPQAANDGIVNFDYVPRPHFEAFHRRSERWSCLVCHRRAGKTVACVNELIARASYTKKENARYAYVAPFYTQAKDVAWEYLKKFAAHATVKVYESRLRVELFNGAWITLYGADNPDALRGIYLDGVVLDEFGDCRPNLWAEVILPTLADRKGWAVFIGTPKGKNQFYHVNKRAKQEKTWFEMTLKASQSKILDEEELTEMKAQMTDDQYAQELECSFEAAVLGTYYASIINMIEDRGQINNEEQTQYDPQFPVFAASDLGYTDSCAWWFWQIRPDGLAIIDYYEEDSQPLSHYFDMLIDTGYNFQKIYLPHDARAKTLQTGRSTIEQFLHPERLDPQYAGVKFPVTITPNLRVQHGIDAGRLLLPKCYFNKENCSDGIEALRAYRRSYDKERGQFANEPFHDWASDGADAFRYLALVSKANFSIDPRHDVTQADIIQPKMVRPTLEQLFKDNERAKHKSLVETLRV